MFYSCIDDCWRRLERLGKVDNEDYSRQLLFLFQEFFLIKYSWNTFIRNSWKNISLDYGVKIRLKLDKAYSCLRFLIIMLSNLHLFNSVFLHFVNVILMILYELYNKWEHYRAFVVSFLPFLAIKIFLTFCSIFTVTCFEFFFKLYFSCLNISFLAVSFNFFFFFFLHFLLYML